MKSVVIYWPRVCTLSFVLTDTISLQALTLRLCESLLLSLACTTAFIFKGRVC